MGRRSVASLAVCVAAWAAGVCGCAERGGGGGGVAFGPGALEALASPGPFAPASVRVYPLTNVERTGESARIVLHLELRDAWGDTVKGVGRLLVRLYRSTAVPGAAGGIGEEARRRQELVWEVDLTDLELNASLYDPSTRTYRVVLGELPEWASALAAGEAAGLSVTLVAVWIGRDAGGAVVNLRDVYRLGG